MKDKEFLQWIYDRLRYQYDESIHIDYMNKLRNIIEHYDDEKVTPNILKG